ncbi:hypothetical protein [Burkholderia ubonensis]|uniref:hypothetical protein n=1 Tax=Burkholderia ubonensis TaxID=101571 RepID=UPI0012F9628B|nr:hypothetical protein [Burkholderia ubonensis]
MTTSIPRTGSGSCKATSGEIWIEDFSTKCSLGEKAIVRTADGAVHPTDATHAHHSIAQRFESFWRVDIHNERRDSTLSSGSIHPHLRNAQHFEWLRKPDIHNEHDSPADRLLPIETPRQTARNDRLQAD